jgi:hypothetical protein
MAGITGTIKDAQNKIHTNVTAPYMAIIGPSKVTIAYDKLLSYGVCALMFNAGSRFDGAGNTKVYYKNTYLDSQVKQCMAADFPFALYADVRSKNVIQADAECKSLYYILAEYPPKLGIWLHMCTGTNVKVNDQIIDVYYKYIERWGFKERCGIYIAKDKLNTFSWSNYQDKFYLLAVDHVKDFKSIDGKLLMPEMFEVPD